MNSPIAFGLAVATFTACTLAQTDSQSQDAQSGALVLSSEALLGANLMDSTAKGASAKKIDSIADFVVQVPSGRVTSLILASGAIVSPECLQWNVDSKCFCYCADSAEDATSAVSGAMNASAKRDEATRATAASFRHQHMLASKLNSCPIVGIERTQQGRKNVELGSIGGMFIDVRSNHVVFLTTSVGGVLGMGADSKVIPWNATDLRCDGESHQHKLHTRLTAKRLDKSPNYGTGAKKLHNPEYRSQLYSFYGCDKPDFDYVASADRGTDRVVTLAKVIGAKLRGTQGDRSIKDLMVNTKTGKTPYAVLDNGQLLPTSAFSWDWQTSCFAVSGDLKNTKVENRADYVMASSLENYTVSATDGEYGALENLYFNTKDAEIAYLTLAVGTTLGFGGDIQVLPWSVVSIKRTNDATHLRLGMTKAALKNAPKLDGATGSDMHSPEFRSRVQSVCKQQG